MNILVTGGCGFIGSHFIEEIFKTENITKIYNVDCGTYAANKKLPFQDNVKYQRLNLDISAPYFPDQKKYFESLNLDYVIHFAAESHVDNSIKGPKKFIDTNINGTFNLLEIFKDLNIKKFIHVSTDEVFGSLGYKESEFTVKSAKILGVKVISENISRELLNIIKENMSVTGTERARLARKKGIEPGTDEWFEHWFSLPYMTGAVNQQPSFRGRKK